MSVSGPSGVAVTSGSGATVSGTGSVSSGSVVSDLDPIFLRALRLLHSSKKDAAGQLKAMLDESIRLKKSSGSGHLVPVTSSASSGSSIRDEQRKNFESLKRDLTDLMPEAKRPRLHGSPAPSGFNKSHTPSPTPTPTPPVVSERLSPDSSADEADLDLEGLNDLSCCICKNWNQGSGNKLMECHTCQDLYHQECHTPVISNEDAADPRLIWHCSQCRTTPAPKAQSASVSSSASSKSLKSGGIMKPKSSSTSSLGSQQSSKFKRNEKQSGSSGSSKQTGGMAGLAASFKGSSSSSSKSSSRSGSSSSSFSKSSSSASATGSSSSGNLMNAADKRLQMMRKKAAAQRKK